MSDGGRSAPVPEGEAPRLAPLPTFVIAGAQRSGTTSLTHWLRDHPDVLMGTGKELRYFDDGWEQGETLDEYRARFGRWSGERAVGEATPNYLFHPDAMARLASVAPAVKIIVSLRNPADRAYSQFWARFSRGVEQRDFDTVMRAELAGDVQPNGSLFARGCYHEQLERTLEHFPREQLLVLLFDDVEHEPRSIYTQVCRYIGVDETIVTDEVGQTANGHRQFRSNALRRATRNLPKPARTAIGRLNSKAATYPPMAATTRTWLLAEYRPHNEALAGLLDRDLTAWDR
jgi:hypothetical protein